ncbi:hypothetical protein [Spiroplasma endosymbiont of Poecilobothrus nobilitatus]|uniref:hypothetical protein n=1 Tax=Spiroplasma endosymbiont of Poecilobothrus nobilitatus TaxID=1209220 RepID=UPI00313E2946
MQKKDNLRNDFYVLIDGIIEFKSTDYKEWISTEPLNALKDLGTISENKPEAILLAIKEKYPKTKMEEVKL